MTMLVTTVGKATVVKAGEFKAKCLEMMDRVAETGGVIVITKRGKPVAQLSAVSSRPATLVGYLKEQIDFVDDAITPVDVEWGPASASPRRRAARRP
jgi:prevent-host-death family protein